MAILNFLINQVFVNAQVFLGVVALIGLVLQRKSIADVVEGTAKTIVGIFVLFAGIDVFLGAINPLVTVLNSAFGVTGVIPDCFGPFGIAMKTLAREISMTFILAFIIHLVLVRVIPKKGFKNVFMTGHIMLFQAGWWVVVLGATLALTGAPLILVAAIGTGILWTILPAMARPFTKEMTNDEYTLGHLNTLAIVFGSWIGKLFKGTKKSDELELPGFWSIFSDYQVLLAFLMPIVFLIIGLIAGQAAIVPLAGTQNWIIFLIFSGLKFSAGVAIVLFGVRMFLAAMIPAFQGISQTLLPGAILGLDCPVFYPFAPVASILGFLADFVGAILVTLFLIVIRSPVVVLPGPIFFFFDGTLAGVFGDRLGGWKGAVVAGFVMGIFVHLGTVLLYPLEPVFHGTGVLWSGPDMVMLLPIFWILKFIGSALGLR
jgi:PTS system ascorbate-specific IIC component